MKNILIPIILVLSVQAFKPAKQDTGGWTSGGGHLQSLDQNPWFIQNTDQVQYCIQIDENNFGQSSSGAKKAFENALAYWKKQFPRQSRVIASGEESQGAILEIATQEFRESECSPETHLRLQLGVLSAEQREYLQDPGQYVGISVRTEYDRVQLRGKGFIYISPEKGALAIKSQTVQAGLWQRDEGKRLEVVLIHELGHVFGLKHDGADSWNEVMSETFPDRVVSQAQFYWDQADYLPTFETLNIDSYCNFKTAEEWKILGLDGHRETDLKVKWQKSIGGENPPGPKETLSYRCLRIKAKKNGADVFARFTNTNEYKQIGRLERRNYSFDGSFAIVMQLPEEQNVFSNLANNQRILRAYVRPVSVGASTFYSSISSVKSELIEMLSSSSYEVHGLIPGKTNILKLISGRSASD